MKLAVACFFVHGFVKGLFWSGCSILSFKSDSHALSSQSGRQDQSAKVYQGMGTSRWKLGAFPPAQMCREGC